MSKMNETKFNLLEIDLTTGEKKKVDVTEDVKKYIGGRGLGAKLLWDRVSAGTDPLSPENILYFGVGPITGFMGSVTNVTSLSPLTLLRGESNMNGLFGVEMVYAGCNGGVLLKGKANPTRVLPGKIRGRHLGRAVNPLGLEPGGWVGPFLGFIESVKV